MDWRDSESNENASLLFRKNRRLRRGRTAPCRMGPNCSTNISVSVASPLAKKHLKPSPFLNNQDYQQTVVSSVKETRLKKGGGRTEPLSMTLNNLQSYNFFSKWQNIPNDKIKRRIFIPHNPIYRSDWVSRT